MENISPVLGVKGSLVILEQKVQLREKPCTQIHLVNRREGERRLYNFLKTGRSLYTKCRKSAVGQLM